MATQLDMAEQQLFAWHSAKAGENLKQLVSGMGLTKEEWQSLVLNKQVGYLTAFEKQEIDDYFRESES